MTFYIQLNHLSKDNKMLQLGGLDAGLTHFHFSTKTNGSTPLVKEFKMCVVELQYECKIKYWGYSKGGVP